MCGKILTIDNNYYCGWSGIRGCSYYSLSYYIHTYLQEDLETAPHTTWLVDKRTIVETILTISWNLVVNMLCNSCFVFTGFCEHWWKFTEFKFFSSSPSNLGELMTEKASRKLYNVDHWNSDSSSWPSGNRWVEYVKYPIALNSTSGLGLKKTLRSLHRDSRTQRVT